MIDLGAVAARMIELEHEIPQSGPGGEMSGYEVVAKLLDFEAPIEAIVDALAAETRRAQVLAEDYYAPRVGRPPWDPGLQSMIGFLQGVTFARAVRDINDTHDEELSAEIAGSVDRLEKLEAAEAQREALREYLDEAITKWRALRDDETLPGRPDTRICACYVDAFQSVRTSILGELLP